MFIGKRALIILTALALVALTTLPSLAKTVSLETVGTGFRYADALDDALNEAVRKFGGTFVYSSSNSVDGALTESRVYAANSGLVQNHEVVKTEKTAEGNFRLTVRVDVSEQGRNTSKALSQNDPWEGKIKDIDTLTQRQEKLRAGQNILKEMTGDPRMLALRGYSFHKVGYEVNDIGGHYVSGALLVRIERNQAFWDDYWSLLRTLEDKSGETINEGFYGSPPIDEGRERPATFYNKPTEPGRFRHIEALANKIDYINPLRLRKNQHPVQVHLSLGSFLAKPITVDLAVGQATGQVVLHKNALMMGDPEINPKNYMGEPSPVKLFGTPNYSLLVPSDFLSATSGHGAVYVAPGLLSEKEGITLWNDYVETQDRILFDQPPPSLNQGLAWLGDNPLVSTHLSNTVKLHFTVRSMEDLEDLAKKDITLRTNVIVNW